MRRFLYTVLLISFSTGIVGAAEGSGPAEPVTTSIQKEPIDTVVPIYRAYVTTTGNDQFSFIVPEGFRLAGDPAHGRLQIVNVEGSCFVSFNIIRPVAADSEEGLKSVYRGWLLERFVDGKIKQEFSRPVLGHNAPAFDVEWKNGGLPQKARAIFVPSNAGLLELIITSSAKNSKTAERDLNEITTTLVEGINGKLQVRHLTNTGT